MTIASDAVTMTAEQFLALPENGMDRELIAGQLREKPMTFTGGAGFWLQDHTIVGIDIAYVSAGADARNGIISGAPVLAVEILSPSDTQETITVYQSSQEPVLFNSTQALDGGANLPGFSVKVSELFA